MLAGDIDGLAAEQGPHDGEALVHAPPPCSGVDAADLELVGVLATEPDTEEEATRREGGKVSHLAGHGDGVAEREQIDRAGDDPV